MKSVEAAEKIRGTFQPEALPPEGHRKAQFVADVATELGIEHTPHNLVQLADALQAAGCEPDANDFPKMVYSRQRPKKQPNAVYSVRHYHWHVIVHNQQELEALGPGWVENPDDLPEVATPEATLQVRTED